MKNFLFGLFIFFGFYNNILAQQAPKQQIKREKYCSYAEVGFFYGNGKYLDKPIYSKPDDAETNRIIEKILTYSGLKKNFIVKAANVPNAEASIKGELRYILYNVDFLKTVKETTQSNWASISILAHEIGHHLLGHTLGSGGSSPKLELDADYFSGYTLQKMGSPIETSTLAMDNFAMVNISLTHPKRMQRVDAVKKGWNDSFKISPTAIDESDLYQPQSAIDTTDLIIRNEAEQLKIKNDILSKTTTNEISDDKIVLRSENFVSKCIFKDDTTSYYVMQGHNIVIAKNNKFEIVGQKVQSPKPAYQWLFKSEFGNYYVKKEGIIVGLKPNGSEFEVGFATFPY